MATVKAFRALIPDPQWFESMLENTRQQLGPFKNKLEGRGTAGMGTGDLTALQSDLLEHIARGHLLQQAKEAFYVYEQDSAIGRQRGIWAVAAVQDYVDGKIIIHEETLQNRLSRLADYRNRIGLEGSPVLLTYRADPRINRILDLFI